MFDNENEFYGEMLIMLSKILNVGTALMVSGILLGSVLTSTSWAMLEQKDIDRKSCTIPMGRIKQLEKYALQIIEYHNKDEIRLKNYDSLSYDLGKHFDFMDWPRFL